LFGGSPVDLTGRSPRVPLLEQESESAKAVPVQSCDNACCDDSRQETHNIVPVRPASCRFVMHLARGYSHNGYATETSAATMEISS
jgi:hypothetical protein